MLRDISPSPWAAPGGAIFFPSLTMTDLGNTPITGIDGLLNNYSFSEYQTANLISGSGAANNFTLVTGNFPRGLIIQPPRNNTTAIGWLYDSNTGVNYMNPNGLTILTFDPANMPTTIKFTCGAAINGVKFWWF